MNTTCLINSYNYAQFIGEAVDGALRQTRPFDEIIIVDDGSTDGTLELLRAKYASRPHVKIVAKPNEGQLSCFNEGFARATGDVVFFLDADDYYDPTYVERALAVYRRDPSCDFLSCGCQLFGEREGVSLNFPDSRDLGYSVIRTTYSRAWIGGVTSSLSMRRQVLEKILPLPFLDDWRTRADDCLVFGASLVGARKRFLAEPLVCYRIHSNNHFCGRKPDAAANYQRRLAVNRLFEHLHRQQSYCIEQLADFPHREFQTIERPSFSVLLEYARISARSHASLVRRLSCVGSMLHHYLSSASRTTPEKQSDAVQATEPPAALRLYMPDEEVTHEASHNQQAGRRRRAA